jgi:virulence factor
MNAPAPIAIGVVGCGWIMRNIYAPILLSQPELIRLTAVCDIAPSSARAVADRFGGAAVFDDIPTMLQKAKLDAVLILTGENATGSVAREVLKRGIPVYVEKPPALDSTELEELIAAEKSSQTFVYTAFNRRHSPLFSALDLSNEKIHRISGALKRRGRPVATFPLTSIHLIDSAQYYGASNFSNWNITFAREARHSVWTIEGRLENGAECVLQLIPDDCAFTEYLILEAETKTCELRFPNSEADVPEGEIIFRPKDGSSDTVMRGPQGLDSVEAMGFQSCLLDFIQHARIRKAADLHRLSSCRSTIRIMKDMEARIHSS